MLAVAHRRYLSDWLFIPVDIDLVPYYGNSVVVTIYDAAKIAVFVKAHCRAFVIYKVRNGYLEFIFYELTFLLFERFPVFAQLTLVL